jgi:hypothetical protein
MVAIRQLADRLRLGLDGPLGGKDLGHLEAALHVDDGQIVRRAGRRLHSGIRTELSPVRAETPEQAASRPLT